MRKASALASVILGFSAVIVAQEPKVERAAIWTDTVKRGEMPVMFAAEESSARVAPPISKYPKI